MQYLKRKNIVRPESTDRGAPYELTTSGRATLAAMKERAGPRAAADTEAPLPRERVRALARSRQGRCVGDRAGEQDRAF